MSWRKNKNGIVIVVFLALMVAVYFLVVKPMIAQIKDKRNKIQENMAIQENKGKRLGDIPKFKKDFELVTEAEAKIQPLLNRDVAVELIQEVEKLAEATNNGVAIEIAPTEAPAKGASKNATETIISSLPVKDYIYLKIKTTGSFFGLLKFLNKLENSTYNLDVVSLQSNRNADLDETREAPISTKNPFGESTGKKDVASGENSREIVSLISVVVYTQN